MFSSFIGVAKILGFILLFIEKALGKSTGTLVFAKEERLKIFNLSSITSKPSLLAPSVSAEPSTIIPPGFKL